MSGFVVLVDKMPEVIEALHKVTAEIVAETAQNIIDEYTGTAARLTGFMADSGYTVTHEGSTYGQAGGGAEKTLPEIPAVEHDQEAYAAIAAEYAAYVEFGTVHMGAQPAFVPAVDWANQEFRRVLSEDLEALVKHKLGGGF